MLSSSLILFIDVYYMLGGNDVRLKYQKNFRLNSWEVRLTLLLLL